MKTYYFIHIKQCNQGSIISWLVCKNIGPVKIAHTHTHTQSKSSSVALCDDYLELKVAIVKTQTWRQPFGQ